MINLLVFSVILVVTAIISWSWVRGIDYMKKNHPDYKGEDFLDWEHEINSKTGRDYWDDNLVHTENEI